MPSSPNYYGGFAGNVATGRPWGSNEERLVQQSLDAQTMPAEVLRFTAPPLPQIEPFRPRMGYGTKDERQATISTVLATGHYYPDRRTDFSGRFSSYSGSSVPSLPNPF